MADTHLDFKELFQTDYVGLPEIYHGLALGPWGQILAVKRAGTRASHPIQAHQHHPNEKTRNAPSHESVMEMRVGMNVRGSAWVLVLQTYHLAQLTFFLVLPVSAVNHRLG